MYCKFCGNFLPDDAKYCPTCGKINEEAEEKIKAEYEYFNDIVPSDSLESKNPPEDPEKKEAAGSILKFSIMGLAFGCSVFLSFLGLIFSYIARGKIKRFCKKYGETSGKASVGKGINIGGLIVSWFCTVFMVIYVALIVLAVIQGLNGVVPNVDPGVTF